jgi:arylsulfatase
MSAAVAGTIAAPAFSQTAARPRRPNILLLMTDQHRVDCMGAYGNRQIHTPHLDRLAHEGVLFRNAYSSTPTCTPARAALLTGRTPWHHGMLGYGKVADRYPIEMPRALRDAGYQTMMIGKTHWGTERNGHGFHQMLLDEHCPCGDHPMLERGIRDVTPNGFRSDYESWFWTQAPDLDPHATGLGWNDFKGAPFALPENLHATHWTGDTAVRFLNSYQKSDPFFLKVSFIRPHSPYDPPAGWMKRYEDADLPLARAGAWAERWTARNSNAPDIWHGKLPEAEIHKSRAAYYGSISFVDEQIGRILEALERRGWFDETLIVFTSDHGDMLGDQNLWRKSYAYEQSAHIPMLMRWPSGMLPARRGSSMAQPVELRDVLPTFLEAAEINPRTDMDGRSLLELMRANGSGWREYIDLEHDVCYSPDNHWNALTDGRWKYIFHARDGQQQLFDLHADPHELRDLAGETQHAAELGRWRGRLVTHLSERGEPFVVRGDLGLRPNSQLYSPNYPSPVSARIR